MKRNRIGLAAWTLAFTAAAIFLVSPAAAQRYKQINLVSDIPGKAAHTDSHLVNSWGIVRSSTGPFWVADNGTGVSTLYNGSGQAFPTGSPLVVTIPPVPGSSSSATPTGVVFNGENDDFDVTAGNPAIFIFVTEDGTISAWSPNVSFTQAILKVNNSSKAVYKGAALAGGCGWWPEIGADAPSPHLLISTRPRKYPPHPRSATSCHQRWRYP